MEKWHTNLLKMIQTLSLRKRFFVSVCLFYVSVSLTHTLRTWTHTYTYTQTHNTNTHTYIDTRTHNTHTYTHTHNRNTHTRTTCIWQETRRQCGGYGLSQCEPSENSLIVINFWNRHMITWKAGAISWAKEKLNSSFS